MLQHIYFRYGIMSTEYAYISCPKSVVGLGEIVFYTFPKW